MTTVASFLACISLKNDVASAFSTSPGVSRRVRLAGVSNRDVVRRSTRLRAGGAPAAAPRVSLAALGLQEQLRKLCADKSEPDREIRIEEVAKVGAVYVAEPAYIVRLLQLLGTFTAACRLRVTSECSWRGVRCHPTL